jgi:RNA polymerase sigma-B factor
VRTSSARGTNGKYSRRSVGEFLRQVRRDHALTLADCGRLAGRSASAISSYERGRRPSAVFFLDLLDSLPLPGITFNDIAGWFGYRPIATIDPWAFTSIHEYVAGMRGFHDYSRAAFAATLDCPPSTLYGYEHRIKPSEVVLRRLARRYLRPTVSYANLTERFRTLRPTPEDQRLRSLFAEVRAAEPTSARHSALREQLIRENLDLAHRLADRYRFHRVSRDDARQAAAEALIYAVDQSNPVYGDFVPYLPKRVRGAVLNCARLTWMTGTKNLLSTHGGAVARAREELRHEFAREPTAGELATRLGLPTNLIDQVLEAFAACHTVSWDRSERRLERQPADEPGGRECDGLAADLHHFLATLAPGERDVVSMRYLHDMELDEITARTGRPTREVERLLADGLGRLRALCTPGRVMLAPALLPDAHGGMTVTGCDGGTRSANGN